MTSFHSDGSPKDAATPTTDPSAEETALLAVADAAEAWWNDIARYGWTLDDHLADPEANAETEAEYALCRAVAQWKRLGG